MTSHLMTLFSAALVSLFVPGSVGATIPAPSNGVALPSAAPTNVTASAPLAVQAMPAVQSLPPLDWAARMVRPCAKVGNRVSC
jgi:hypothetical protein